MQAIIKGFHNDGRKQIDRTVGGKMPDIKNSIDLYFSSYPQWREIDEHIF